MGIRSRATEADFYKISKEATSFQFMGTGFTGINEKPNGQTSEKRYVCDSSTTTTINKYNWNSEVTADQIANDAVIEDIVSIGKELKIGEEAEREYLKVDLDRPGQTEKTYYARKFKVAVQITEYPDNDGELQVNATFLGLGDPVIGTATITDATSSSPATATFAEGFTAKTS